MISLPSIFSIGAIVFAFLSPFQAVDASIHLPLDEKVHIREFKNGVTAYVHKNYLPEKSASIRVLVDKAGEIGSYDCAICSENLSELDAFFEDCKVKIQKENTEGEKRALTIIAVGDLLADVVAKLVESHFATINQPASYVSSKDAPLRVRSSNDTQMLGLRINYPNPKKSLRTLDDLRSKWKEAISQQILQERLQKAAIDQMSLSSPETCTFLLPADSFTATLYCPEAQVFEMTDLLYNELERLKIEGISEEEFARARGFFLKRLQDFSHHSEKSNAFLVSYHENLFSHDTMHPSFEAFVSASFALLPEITWQEVTHNLQTSLRQQDRTIDVLLPSVVSEGTEDGIQEALSSFLISASNQTVHPKTQLPVVRERTKSEELSSETTISPVTWDPFKDPYDSLPLTSEEKRIIDKIFTTMARKNVVQLAFEKKTLERNGKRINHVHPMKMLGTLFSDARLKDCIKKIRKSSFKWSGFLDGLVGRLKEEHRKDNLLKYAPGLSNLLGVNSDKVKKYLKDQEWEDLVVYLLEH